ncbi:hypothetical protein THASP1DRAFT_30858 [Thamnocephalis sphaerospora]|uniref:Uncharacterized protein n=1 Tax=Thamnocephalis sphaerospora TaxID=78915 RepID=A0A4P9XN35_9FUNG|nr:hypothetical protein THASP1DRAFT_30858 [Thamnocephalis sphaerospora]|eukprot:RKP07326.1 hypothetical protein THASP1DRAFT_30858 [Thamnocephalis sphaerospora]
MSLRPYGRFFPARDNSLGSSRTSTDRDNNDHVSHDSVGDSKAASTAGALYNHESYSNRGAGLSARPSRPLQGSKGKRARRRKSPDTGSIERAPLLPRAQSTPLLGSSAQHRKRPGGRVPRLIVRNKTPLLGRRMSSRPRPDAGHIFGDHESGDDDDDAVLASARQHNASNEQQAAWQDAGGNSSSSKAHPAAHEAGAASTRTSQEGWYNVNLADGEGGLKAPHPESGQHEARVKSEKADASTAVDIPPSDDEQTFIKPRREPDTDSLAEPVAVYSRGFDPDELDGDDSPPALCCGLPATFWLFILGFFFPALWFLGACWLASRHPIVRLWAWLDFVMAFFTLITCIVLGARLPGAWVSTTPPQAEAPSRSPTPSDTSEYEPSHEPFRTPDQWESDRPESLVIPSASKPALSPLTTPDAPVHTHDAAASPVHEAHTTEGHDTPTGTENVQEAGSLPVDSLAITPPYQHHWSSSRSPPVDTRAQERCPTPPPTYTVNDTRSPHHITAYVSQPSGRPCYLSDASDNSASQGGLFISSPYHTPKGQKLHPCDREPERSTRQSASGSSTPMPWRTHEYVYAGEIPPSPLKRPYGIHSAGPCSPRMPVAAPLSLSTPPQKQDVSPPPPLHFATPQYKHHLSPPPTFAAGLQSPRRDARESNVPLPPGVYLIDSRGPFNIVESPACGDAVGDQERWIRSSGPQQQDEPIKQRRFPIVMFIWLLGWLIPPLWIAGSFWCFSRDPRERLWGTLCFANFVLLMAIVAIIVVPM